MSLPVQDGKQNIIAKLHPGHDINPVHGDMQLSKPEFPIIETARNYTSFPSLALGSKNLQFVIQQGLICKQIIIAMQLSGSATASVCSNAAYALIDQIGYRVGGSTQYQNSGFTNWIWGANMLKTSEGIQYLYSLGGGDAAAVPASGRWVYAVINTPFSRMMLTESRYGVDTNILKQPISVFLSLSTNAQVYTADTSMTSLMSGQFQICASEYINSGDRSIPDDGKFLTLPTRYIQDYQSSSFTPSGATSLQSIALSSFRSGNLTHIILCAQDNANALTTNAFKLNTMTNLKVQFNNQVIYQSIEESYKLLDMNDSFGQTTSYTAYGKTNLPICVKFTPRKFNSIGHNQSLGLSLGSQTLTCSFNVTDSTAAQSLRCLFVYDSLILYNETEQDILV